MKGAHRKRGMTTSNCAIDLDKQARMYHEWMNREQRCTIHLYPAGHPASNAQKTREYFLGVFPLGRFVIRDVNPEDWK